MGVGFDYTESFSAEHSNESQATTYVNDSPTSPLDLSKTSTRFPFIPRSTSTDDGPPSLVDLSKRISDVDDRQMSIDCSYEEPIVLTEPKSEWHYRSLKDLAKKHIPFVSGVGPQRTPIRVKVPEKSDRQMYLGISVVTYDGQPHDSKIIVPAKTKVDTEHVSHDNNLDCLLFDECHSTDYFDSTTRHVYLQINAEEHRAQLKEVRLHMFNLYQNHTITKDIIEAKQLHLCRLAFWLCYLDNKHYIPISQHSFSCIMREKKNSIRSCVSQQIVNQMNLSDSYSIASIKRIYQDATNNNDDHFFTFSVIE